MKEYTEIEAQNIVDNISFAPSGIQMHETGMPEFEVKKNEYGFMIRCSFWRPDTRTGLNGQGYGRWYHCPSDTSEKGLIMTAWLAFEQIVKHEMMECFLYKGVRLFDPHKSLEELAFPQELPKPEGPVKRFFSQFGKGLRRFLNPEGPVTDEMVEEAADDLSEDLKIKDDALRWWIHGEHGLSSKAMARCFENEPQKDLFGGEPNYPHDAGDFGRCYKLLKAVPQWNTPEYMNKLRELSPMWNNLVDVWDELTAHYEAKEYQEVYDLIQKCKAGLYL